MLPHLAAGWWLGRLMHRWVNSMCHALVPYNGTLAFGSSDSGMIVASRTCYASVPEVGSELHVPCFLLVLADSAFNQSALIPWHHNMLFRLLSCRRTAFLSFPPDG